VRRTNPVSDRADASGIVVTHDLGIVSRTCDRVAVMYAGRIVETGPVRRIFGRPAHPYTRALLGSIPRARRPPRAPVRHRGPAAPDLARLPAGCAFAPRCPRVMDRCRREAPRVRSPTGT
jgi:oligopeptide/dipeptide ABC transporter ATP-binding protein